MPTHSLYLTTNIPTTTPEIPIFSAEGGDTTITMTFSPNDDGGTPITGYQYSFDGFITNTAIGINSSPFTITGLETGRTFDIELRAVNKNGYGIQTNSADITLVPLPPSQPIINSVTPLDRSVEINFTAGNNNGSIIRYYILTWSSDNFVTTLPSTPIQINAPYSNPYTIPSNPLTNGIPYKIKLVAHNDNGDSQPTTSESFTPSTTPSAPTFSVASGNGFATLSNFVTANNGGSAVINYQYSTNGGFTFTAFSPAQTTGSYVITPLTNGQTFQIQMKAVNGIGPGTPTISQPVTLSTTPSAPTFSVASGNGFATLSNFITANNGGSAVINYQFSSDNGLNFTAFSPAQTTGSYVITSLTNGQTFQIQMKAVNEIGPGTPTISQPVTPDSPVNTLINQYTTSIWLDTTTPSSNFILNGDNVITWKDKTSNGFNLTSVDKTNYISTSPTSVLISTGAYFKQTNYNMLTSLQTWLFVVSFTDTTPASKSYRIAGIQNSINSGGVGYLIQSNKFIIYDHGNNNPDGIGFNFTPLSNMKYLISVSLNTSTSYTTAKANSIMRVNGITQTGFISASNSSNYKTTGTSLSLLIGAIGVSNNFYPSTGSFNIHELIGINNQALGINDIQTIETYLNTKWNLGYTIT